MVDDARRMLLLSEIGKAVHDTAAKLARNMGGDYANDPAASRFPVFAMQPAPVRPKTREAEGIETIQGLFDR